MFYCDNCGNPVPDNSRHCPNCGAPILRRTGGTRPPKRGDEVNPWVVLALIVFGGGMWLWYYFAVRDKAGRVPESAPVVVVAGTAAAEVLDTFPADLEPEPVPEPETAAAPELPADTVPAGHAAAAARDSAYNE